MEAAAALRAYRCLGRIDPLVSRLRRNTAKQTGQPRKTPSCKPLLAGLTGVCAISPTSSSGRGAPLLGRCSVGAIPHAPYAPWLAAHRSPIEQSRLSWVLAWWLEYRAPPGMQFSDFYGSVHNLCTICKSPVMRLCMLRPSTRLRLNNGPRSALTDHFDRWSPPSVRHVPHVPVAESERLQATRARLLRC